MSKYIKLISLVLFIAVALTGFSLYNAQTSSAHPELKIVTSEGKPEYVEPVRMLGFVTDSQIYTDSSTVKFDEGDFTYIEEFPFFKQLDFDYNNKINDLITDYRSFMRSKSRRPEHYTETEQYIIYSGMESDVHWNNYSSSQMTLSILDKETEEEETHSISLNNEGSYNNIRAAYIDYPQLALLVETYGPSDNPENIVYTLNLENPTEGVTEVINLTEETGRTDSLYIGQLYDTSERFIPLQTIRQTVISDYDYTEEISGYFADYTETQEVIDIPMFEERTLLFTDNNTLYVGKVLEDSIELYEMNEENQDMSLLGTIPSSIPSIGQEEYVYNFFNQNMTILDGKLYAYGNEYTEEASSPILQITDIETQETLFDGTIEPKDSTDKNTTDIKVYDFSLDPS